MRTLRFLAQIAVVAAFCANVALGQEPIVIFDGRAALDDAQLQDVVVTSAPNGGIEIRNGLKDNWPGVHFTGLWDLGHYDRLELFVRSTSEEPITLYCRLDCQESDTKTMEGIVTRQIILEPGESAVWKVELPGYLNLETRRKLFAMRGKPGGIATDAYSVDQKIPFDKRALTAIRPFENQNKRGDSWILEKIVAVPTPKEKLDAEAYLLWEPERFFPMIDEFGQFRHADWPGKTHSVEELRAQIAIEDADLKKNQPDEFDEYGGWLNGPQLEATGAFRVEKIDGVWYFVDPIGRLFWSHGVDCVGHWNAVTPVADREFYFVDAVPTSRDSQSPFAQFLSTSSRSVNNYYAGRGEYLQYNFSASNLYLKYGDDWESQARELARRRLRSWGMNTFGNWSNFDYIRDAKTPYVATFSVSGNCPNIEGSSGYWGKFVDPFHPEFPRAIRAALDSQKGATATDPYCLGYFVDNEISWGEVGSLARAALASPKDQPAKIAFVDWLKDRYESIERFNAEWRAAFNDWNELLDQPFEAPKNEQANEDCNAFYKIICERYFAEIANGVHDVAPQRLYLGCRFAWTNDLARAAAQKYCDVVSYNFYKYEVGSFKPVEGEDKPVIIGEFHFGALDRGLFHAGLCPRDNQTKRAEAYREYVESALANPWIIGAHWFQYGDEATTGRFDGENYQIGLIDVCDRPYPETIAAVREVGYHMYKTRAQQGVRK